MSDALNHYFCGTEVINNLNPEIKAIVDKNLFFLGTQGSDMFFYYNILYWNNPVPFGNIIHHKRINLFFYNFFKFLSEQDNTIIKNKILSYIFGFTCHHSLDYITHPFIIYRSGIYDKSNKETSVFQYMHKKYEVLLDVALLKYKYDIDAVKFKFNDIFTLKKNNIEIIQNLYDFALKNTYNLEANPNVLLRSINSERIILNLLSNPKSIKTKLLTLFEKLFLNKGYITTAIYPKETDIDLVLNLNNSLWRHPCNNEIISNLSFIELFENAVNDATNKILKLYSLMEGIIKPENINSIYNDISYETGLDCNNSCELTYYDKDFVETLISLS
ncbi:MAG: zinc dependent phospholipase C family protein [Eubacteriaceae bacterium]